MVVCGQLEFGGCWLGVLEVDALDVEFLLGSNEQAHWNDEICIEDAGLLLMLPTSPCYGSSRFNKHQD
jgi:hypothetical protein